MTLEERVEQLEKRVAELEANQAQLQFVPEDSENGICKDLSNCNNPYVRNSVD